MPRQNFVSRNFFVPATEKQAVETIKAIPHFVSYLEETGIAAIGRSFRFRSTFGGQEESLYVDVSLLRLDHEFTQVGLHASFLSGKVIGKNPFPEALLQNFEQALLASLKGDVSLFRPLAPEPSFSHRVLQYVAHPLSLLLVVLLRKKLS
jgi:hypothetical protein